MATLVVYADYAIFFAIEAEYQAAIAMNGGSNFFYHRPDYAVSLFGLPAIPPGGASPPPDKFFTYYPGYIPPIELHNPLASGIFLIPSIDSITAPPQASSYGEPGVNSLQMGWCGIIAPYGTGGGNEPPVDATPIPMRRWIGGLEMQALAEGGTSLNTGTGCRDSSRTIDGKGLPLRANNPFGGWTRQVAEYNPGYTPKKSWERFYVRLRTLPTGIIGFWRCHCATAALSGAGFKIDTDGTIKVYNINSGGIETLIGTTPALVIDDWYLIDVVLEFAAGPAADGFLKVFINHDLILNITIPNGQDGMARNDTHLSSEMNRWTAADATLEMDIDDWICADVPNKAGVESLDSIDWLVGSHVKISNVVSVALTNYVGQKDAMNQGVNPALEASSRLTSSTSGAEADGTTDVPDMETLQTVQEATGVAIGPVAAVVAAYTETAAGADGQLGYRIADGAPVLATINEQVASQWFSKLYRPSGLLLPEEFAPFHVVKTKSADANLNTVRAVQAALEYIGAWGPEDDPGMVNKQRTNFLHNCRYVNTFWGQPILIPDAPVFAVGGTYVGNSTAQTINLPAPCHFLWIRALAGGSTGIKFFGASLGGHGGVVENVLPHAPVRMFVDDTGQAQFTVNGSSIEVNLTATTYQYIAFCDPGMRFNICDAYNRPSTLATAVKPLFNSLFLAKGGFVQKEFIGTGGGATALSYKGPGHGANDGNEIPGGVIADWGSFAAGVLNTRSGIHYNVSSQVNFSLWRETDDCGSSMLQIFSYQGNGSSPRDIPFPLTSGRFPLLVVVMPHNATAFMRDPSHTANNSCSVAALTNSTTAITGVAIDQITVGATLNSNGIIYDVFAIMGDTAGMNNGIFYPSQCGAGWPAPPPVPPFGDINITAEGGLTLDGTTPQTLLEDVSGIYTLIPGKRNDTLYDRQTGQPNVDVEIPDPGFKTGFIGG